MIDKTGTTTRIFDELNRTTSKAVPGIGTSTYAYDITASVAAGQIKETAADAKGNIVEKIYDKAGRLYTVTASGKTTTYYYYDNGNRQGIVYPNNAREEFIYYDDNTLMTVTNKKADGSILSWYSYTYDAANNQKTKTDAKGTTNYDYDSLNRLEKTAEPNGKVTTYTYDMAGNRQTETIANGESVSAATTYSYNEQNRLTDTVTVKANGLSEKLTYNYDDNGNLISKFRATVSPAEPNILGSFAVFKAGENDNNDVSMYEYDKWNQLTKTTEGNKSITYAYNGEGYRIQKTINTNTTKYLYEGDKVVLEVNGAGVQTAANVYGTNLISRTTGGETAYYLYNGHGDVTALIGTDGTVKASYYYDAFGNITEQTGSVDNPIRYAGYQYDEETELYYLNARYYDSKIARFMTEDTYRGSASDPLSLNLYSYVSNNPIKYVDPTGHWQQGDEDYSQQVRIELSRLTDAYFAAKTPEEKTAIHNAANDLRENSTKYGNQNGSTGANYNAIVDDKADGYKYVTAREWSSISTTKNDAVVKQVTKDGKITNDEIDKIAPRKPTNTAVVKNSPMESIVRKVDNSKGQYTPPLTQYFSGITISNGSGSNEAAIIDALSKATSNSAIQVYVFEDWTLGKNNYTGKVFWTDENGALCTYVFPFGPAEFLEATGSYGMMNMGATATEMSNAIRSLISAGKTGVKALIKALGGVSDDAAKAIGKGVNKTVGKSSEVTNLLDNMPELTGSNRDKLLSAIQNPDLRSIANELYRPGATVGDGGTATGLVQEFYDGTSRYLQKATERLKGLNDLAMSGKLGLNDLDILEALRNDLTNAIKLFK